MLELGSSYGNFPRLISGLGGIVPKPTDEIQILWHANGRCAFFPPAGHHSDLSGQNPNENGSSVMLLDR